MARIPFLKFALGIMLLTVAPAAHTQTKAVPGLFESVGFPAGSE